MTEIFSIPCNHADCASELFYMKHSQGSPSDGSTYYIIADTKKLIEQIRKDDPEMMEHALSKFEGECATNWIKTNSEENPFVVGYFAFNADGETKAKFTLSEGWAGNLILIQELGLPYVPIAVHKWPDDSEQHAEYLKRLVSKVTLH